jgi:DMSO/TMAO reductase YedYZ molybdopterin-dependent catalytic subunit
MEPNEKIVKAKQKMAQHRREFSCREVDGPQDDRLPEGQHLVNNFPVLDLGYKPTIDLAEWTLTIDGFVANPVTWTWEDFQAQPVSQVQADFHCVTTWSMLDNDWMGVKFQHVLEVVRPLSFAKFVLFESCDDYTTNLPLDVCDDDDVLLATHWKDRPLTKDHGAPVRMIVPKRYAWKGAKWIKKITFLDRDQKGFWEVRGYSNTALPWKNDRYA